MNSSVGLPKEMASLITGLLLLFTACGVYIKYRLKKSKDRLEQEAKLAEAAACEAGKEDEQ